MENKNVWIILVKITKNNGEIDMINQRVYTINEVDSFIKEWKDYISKDNYYIKLQEC